MYYLELDYLHFATKLRAVSGRARQFEVAMTLEYQRHIGSPVA